VRVKFLIAILLFISSFASSKELSEFEKMLSGFPVCRFKNMYYDAEKNYVDNEYFKKKNIKPSEIVNGIAEYDVDENLYGIHVSKLFIPAGTLGLIFVVFDEEYSSVENEIRKYLIYGYNKEYMVGGDDHSQKLVPELRAYDLDKAKTTLACVWPE
jgi:hypothetical protein